MTGETALVTGSTSSIRLGTAWALMQLGVTLILNEFGDMDIAKDAVTQYGKTPDYHRAGPSDEAQIVDTIRYVESGSGGVNTLISNVGIQYVSSVETFSVGKRNAIIVINLSSIFHTTCLAFPGVRTRNWGRIISITSVHGLVTSKEKSVYVAARHGVVGFTKIIALETAQMGITCNALCPGWMFMLLAQQQIDKRIAEGAEPGAARDALLAEKQLSREFVAPEQLDELALFLCSDGAAQACGVARNMDGGRVAQQYHQVPDKTDLHPAQSQTG